MKAIAFAIICAAYLLLPAAESRAWPEWFQQAHGFVLIVCIIGFWFNILFEEK